MLRGSAEPVARLTRRPVRLAVRQLRDFNRGPASGSRRPSQSLQPRGRSQSLHQAFQSLQRPRPSQSRSFSGPHSRCSPPSPHSRCSAQALTAPEALTPDPRGWVRIAVRTEAGRRRATTGAGGVSCLNVLPRCSADRCADGATTEGTVLAAAPKTSIPRRSLPPFPRFPGFPGGCWEGPKTNLESVEKWSSWSPKTGPRTGLEKSILNTLEIVESVEKWSSWSPKTGPRTGLEKSVSNTRKNGAPGHRKQARGRGP